MQPIQFTDTRISPTGSSASPVGIEEAIVRGMAPGGGLYVPSELPVLPGRVFDPAPLSYAELAGLVLSPFFPGWEGGTLGSILEAAYGAAAEQPYFDLPEIAPLRPIGKTGAADGQARLYLLELFHGRTCAFKDMALSVLGGFLRESLSRMGRKEPVLVLVATSGDTGSAALEGLSAVEGVHTAVFYPQQGTSEIQRLQMTTTGLERRFVAGIAGNFDDAQTAVKKIFARAARGEGPLAGYHLSSANSINIGRLLPQIVYYVAAYRALASRGALGEGGLMHVAVPTGNFGDILAAKYAKEMGLPIGRLICASNANKVLADFFETGVYDRRRELVKTESPSMDILVSSNLERLLYMASGNNPERVSALMGQLAAQGFLAVNKAEKAYMADFAAGWCSDASARSAIAQVWESDALLIDPHTATAMEGAMRLSSRIADEAPIVIASTASPFKFPKACLEALSYGVSGSDAEGWGDLELAARLAATTGCAMPGSIFSLGSKKALHDTTLPVEGMEDALGDYAKKNMGARI